MFDTQFDASRHVAQIVVRPNQSLSWRGNLAVLASLGVVMFAIAAGFAAIGLWLVLPFAGFELLVVAAGLYVTCRRLACSEVISVSPQAVQVETGYRRVESRRELAREWVRVELREGAARTQPSRLLIRSHGREIEVGACLTDKERLGLADELRRLLAGPGERTET